MRTFLSTLLKMTPWSALILFLLFWLPFIDLTPQLMILYFVLGLALNSIQIFTKFNFVKIRYIYLFIGLPALYTATGTWKGIDTGIGFLGILAITKMISLREKSDYFLYFLILQLFLCAQLLSSESLYLAVYLIILCPLFFISMHNSSKSKSDTFDINKKRRKVITQLFFTALPMALVLFLVFPRLQFGNIFFSTQLSTSQSGYVEELSPGEISKLVNNDEVIFRANFLELKPASSDLYWRGAILSEGAYFKWSKGKKRPRLYAKRSKQNPSYKIEYDKLQKGALFTLEGTSSVKTLSKASVLAFEGNIFEMTPYSNQKLRYFGTVNKELYSKNPYSDKLLETYKDVKFKATKELLELSKTLKPDKQLTHEEIVSNLVSFYRNNNFKYSLSPGTYLSEEPLNDFFFSRKLGFCEHYAGASASVLRLAGVPTRIVTGFQGAEYNELGQYYIVRARDAHAWLEFWSDIDKKWKRFDPVLYVAPERIQLGNSAYLTSLDLESKDSFFSFLDNENFSYIKRMKLAYDFAYFRLNTLFLSYDLENQMNTLKKLGLRAKSVTALLLYSLGFILITVVIVTLLIQLKIKKIHPADKIIKNLLKKLEKEGYLIQDNETFPSFTKRIKKFEEYEDVSKLYNQIKYAKDSDKSLTTQLKTLVKSYF